MAEEIISQWGDSDVDAERRKAMERYRLSLQNEVQHDENEAQRIMNVAGSTGLPQEMIAGNLDMLEKRLKTGEFDVEKFREEAPEFAKYVSENPLSLAALKKDRENMGMLERATSATRLANEATWAQVELAKVWEESKRTGELPDPKLLEDLRKWQQPHEFGAETGFGRLWVKNVKQYGPTAEGFKRAAKTALPTATSFAGAALWYGQAGPQGATLEEVFTVPAAALVGAKVGGMIGMGQSTFEQEAGSRMDEYMQMGMSFETARDMSNIAGSINVIPEMIGLGFIAKNTPGLNKLTASIGSKLMSDVILKKPTLAKASAAFGLRWGESLGAEVFTEVIQDSVGMVTKEYGRRKDQLGGDALSYESWKNDIAEVAWETAQSALVMTGGGPILNYAADSKRAWDAKRRQVVYQSISKSAKASETRKNVPGAWSEFTKRLGKTDKILIDANGFDTYFQDQNIDPDQVLGELGVDMDEVAEAREMAAGEDGSGYIEVPLSTFVEQIAPTDHHDGLAMHLKANRDQMTLSEANLWEKNNPELIKDLEKLISGDETMLDGVDDKILADVTGQLVAAGHEAGSAQHLAKIMLGIPNMAKRAGKDPMELYNRVFGGIKSVQEEALEKREVDLAVEPLLNRLRNKDFPKAKDVRGVTLMDFLKKSGGLLDQGGELSARDLQLEMPGLVTAKGMELDKAAELAAEAGYIAEADIKMLQEAIDREVSGAAVAGKGADPVAVAQQADLDRLEEIMGMAGLDIDTLTNKEIIDALEQYETMMQDGEIDLTELQTLTEYVFRATSGHRDLGPLDAPGMLDQTMLTLAEKLMSQVSETQDFGEIRSSVRVRDPGTGDTATITGPAQKLFDRKVKERNVLKKLKDCISG